MRPQQLISVYLNDPPTAAAAAPVTGTPNPTPSTIASRDADANTAFNVVVSDLAEQITFGNTVILSSASQQVQILIGANITTIRLPSALTLRVGHRFEITNNTGNNVVVQDASPGVINNIPYNPAGGLNGPHMTVILRQNGDAAGVWECIYIPYKPFYYAHYRANNLNAYAAASLFEWDVLVEDSENLFNPVGNSFVLPETGLWQVTARLAHDGSGQGADSTQRAEIVHSDVGILARSAVTCKDGEISSNEMTTVFRHPPGGGNVTVYVQTAWQNFQGLASTGFYDFEIRYLGQ